MEYLAIEDLSFKYPTSADNALSHVNLKIKKGSFNLVVGLSGSGKSTLLKILKPEIAPYGDKSGNIDFFGNKNVSFSDVGFVAQDPDDQIISDKVWHELSFGLESMGTKSSEIRRRVGETASYFGIANWFYSDTDCLSGGQKQLLNLAAVSVTDPKLLVLDEPTSMLDPISAWNFIQTLFKLNRELGITIVMSEHRMEDIFPFCDNVIVLENGKVVTCGNPKEVCEQIKGTPLFLSLPAAARIWDLLKRPNVPCFLTVKEGKDFLAENFKDLNTTVKPKYDENKNEVELEVKNLYFKYSKSGDEVLKDFSLKLNKGEIYSILGQNGSGKTTALLCMAGVKKPLYGKIKYFSSKNAKVALLPQNPKTIFIKDTVLEDFKSVSEDQSAIEDLSKKYEIQELLNKNPYDLSGGEIQKCALVKLLLTNPKIILLDEPTKGIDAFYKLKLNNNLKDLKKEGFTIVIVTHDIEFAASTADRCGLLFNGKIISEDIPHEFFIKNRFYTTAAHRISREHIKNAILCEEVVDALGN